jgi:hypothetical protein
VSEIASEMQIYRQREERLSADLSACRTATRMVQVGIEARLRDYPELLDGIEARYGAERVPDDPTPDQKILKAALVLAEALAEIDSLKGSYASLRPISPDRGVAILAELLNPELLRLLRKPNMPVEERKKILRARAEPLRTWLSDHEHEVEVKRASMRQSSREDEQEIEALWNRVKAKRDSIR